MLVVFDNDVIIFSDKYVEYDQSIDIKIAWTRWFKKAVQRPAVQIYGAESWLRKYPNRVYLDPNCQKPIPISLPSPDRIRVHRVAVALGIFDACREYFGGSGLGSLIVQSDLHGDQHYSNPFRVGHINQAKGFVHVFEDFTLDAVLREVDTISDFVAYLSKREKFLSTEKPTVIAAGDEQLLAIYLTHLNVKGEHDIILPDKSKDIDGVYLDESFWSEMVQNPQYLAKKQADRISYAWDNLIEHFIKYGGTYDDAGQKVQHLPYLESGLRHMASEPRVRRRQLAHAFVDILKNTPNDKRAVRVVYSEDFPEKAYVFLIVPQLESENYEEYRQYRETLLVAYCKVAKLRCSKANYMVGIATEQFGSKGASEDMVVLDVRDWTKEMESEAKMLQEKGSLLLDMNVKRTEGRTSEWPEVSDIQTRSSDGVKLNRKQRRIRASMNRHKKDN